MYLITSASDQITDSSENIAYFGYCDYSVFQEYFQCLLCFCVCENSGTVTSHVSSAHDDDLLLIHSVCPVCDLQFYNANLLQLHVNTHFDEEPVTSGEYFCFIQLLYKFLSSMSYLCKISWLISKQQTCCKVFTVNYISHRNCGFFICGKML